MLNDLLVDHGEKPLPDVVAEVPTDATPLISKNK